MINGRRSSHRKRIMDVHQGLLIRPILFSLFLTPMSLVMLRTSFKHQVYADDITLYFPVNESNIHGDSINMTCNSLLTELIDLADL